MAAGIATYIGNETWYQRVVMPTLRLLQPETAHSLAIKCAKHGIVPKMKTKQYESLVRWLVDVAFESFRSQVAPNTPIDSLGGNFKSSKSSPK